MEINSSNKDEFVRQIYRQEVQAVRDHPNHPEAAAQKEKLKQFREENVDLFETPLGEEHMSSKLDWERNSPKVNKDIENLLFYAGNANMTVYDQDGDPGVFTEALKVLCNKVMLDNYGEIPKFIITDNSLIEGYLYDYYESKKVSMVDGKHNFCVFVSDNHSLLACY